MDIDRLPSISDRISLFRLERDVRGCELEASRAIIGWFNQSRSKLAVDGDATTDNSMREIFEVGTEI
jgi:hypothetical protein